MSLIEQFSRTGVLHREEVKNSLPMVSRLFRAGYVQKVRKKKKIYYELTEQALPFLESMRKRRLEEVHMKVLVPGHSRVFDALLSDLRFLDTENPAAGKLLFLNDWHLQRPVVPSQLELSKFRYYQERGLA